RGSPDAGAAPPRGRPCCWPRRPRNRSSQAPNPLWNVGVGGAVSSYPTEEGPTPLSELAPDRLVLPCALVMSVSGCLSYCPSAVAHSRSDCRHRHRESLNLCLILCPDIKLFRVVKSVGIICEEQLQVFCDVAPRMSRGPSSDPVPVGLPAEGGIEDGAL